MRVLEYINFQKKRVLTGRVMRTPNESKSSPTTPSQENQPPVPRHPSQISQSLHPIPQQ